MRFFYGHQKGDSDAEIDEAVKHLAEILKAHVPGSVEVVPGRDDFKTRFKGAGGWAGWQRSAALGRSADGSPLFDGFVIPAGFLGRATGSILEQALQAGKPAVLWKAGDQFERIKRVFATNKDDWKAGWDVETSPN